MANCQQHPERCVRDATVIEYLVTMSSTNLDGLVQRWLNIERAACRPLTDVLDELNAACGTHYKHNWLSQIQGRPSQNLPIEVRRYMMRKVLPGLLDEATAKSARRKIDFLIVNLT